MLFDEFGGFLLLPHVGPIAVLTSIAGVIHDGNLTLQARIELHTLVEVLPDKQFQQDGVDYYKQYDQGTVSKMQGFNGENDEFQTTWHRTGETSSITFAEWPEWFKIIGKARCI